MKFTDEQKQAVAEVCNKLLGENEENLSDPSDVYAQGYQDRKSTRLNSSHS